MRYTLLYRLKETEKEREIEGETGRDEKRGRKGENGNDPGSILNKFYPYPPSFGAMAADVDADIEDLVALVQARPKAAAAAPARRGRRQAAEQQLQDVEVAEVADMLELQALAAPRARHHAQRSWQLCERARKTKKQKRLQRFLVQAAAICS